jgi:hypothetical protein
VADEPRKRPKPCTGATTKDADDVSFYLHFSVASQKPKPLRLSIAGGTTTSTTVHLN